MITKNKYRQNPECLLEDMDGELLLYHPPTATTLHLNGPSAIVWELCTGERSVAEIIDALQQAYPSQSDQIEGDVVSVINDFIAHQVLLLDVA